MCAYSQTSSEHQGEKSSPAEQEADCRQLATEKGLVIVNVYRELKSIAFEQNYWSAKFEEYPADWQTGIAELKNVAPQNEEEQHNLFLLKKNYRYFGRTGNH